MGLTVTRARVKDRAGITSSTYDATIDSLIAELVPAIEFAVRTEHVNDLTNTGLQATLNLGALEIVTGEFIAQFIRVPGSGETLSIEGIKLEPWWHDPIDPSGLRSLGWQRLRSYRKDDPAGQGSTAVRAGGGKGPLGEPAGGAQ
jgi:hypothetical protein